MSRSFFPFLRPLICTLLLHGLDNNLIISYHINHIGMAVYILLSQFTVKKETVMLRVWYQKPVLPLCHKTVTHSFPAIGIVMCIKSYLWLCKIF